MQGPDHPRAEEIGGRSAGAGWHIADYGQMVE